MNNKEIFKTQIKLIINNNLYKNGKIDEELFLKIEDYLFIKLKEL